MTFSPLGLHVIAKPIGPACNLNCTYCFYLEKAKLFPKSEDFRMSDEVLSAFIRQYDGEYVWQGGEPTLLGLDYFQKVIQFQAKYHPGKKCKNSLQTNGTRLDDRWGKFLKENDWLVGLSLDGPPEIHDRYRCDRAGKGTFDNVLSGLRLLKKHGVEFNVLASVAKETAEKPLEVYRCLKAEGVEFIQFTAVVERDLAGKVAPWSVDPESYGDFLIAIFDEWVREDVGRVFVLNFEWALNAWVGNPSPICLFAENCGRSLVIEHNGDVYSCDHFVYPEYRLGNVLQDKLKDLVELPRQKAFGASKQELPAPCRRCDFLFACRGECPKRKQYLCAGYKKYFSHIAETMNGLRTLLEHNRPASDIIKTFKGPLFMLPDKGEKK